MCVSFRRWKRLRPALCSHAVRENSVSRWILATEFTLDREAYGILRRYQADCLMVYADSPLDERLKTLPGFSPVEDAPRARYSLYKVDLERLDKPAWGSNRPRETAPPAPEPS